MAKRCVAHWPPPAEKLAGAFWPGPLTLVLPRAKEIPDVVTAGGPTVGVRWPSHPFIQAVIRACDFPLAAPSANPSNRVSPTTAEHVRKHLGHKIPLIVDGGQAQIGIESTVLDLSVSPPRLLRPGMIHEQALVAVTGRLALDSGHGSEVLKSPGLLRKHYSPRARLVIASWRDGLELEAQTSAFKVPRPGICVTAHTHISAAAAPRLTPPTSLGDRHRHHATCHLAHQEPAARHLRRQDRDRHRRRADHAQRSFRAGRAGQVSVPGRSKS